jgi:hypothetical protein
MQKKGAPSAKESYITEWEGAIYITGVPKKRFQLSRAFAVVQIRVAWAHIIFARKHGIILCLVLPIINLVRVRPQDLWR